MYKKFFRALKIIEMHDFAFNGLHNELIRFYHCFLIYRPIVTAIELV